LRTHLQGVTSVRCTGNTDVGVSAFANWLVGEARAVTICDYLAKPTHLGEIVASNGANVPVASNSTAAGRALNRRVDVKFSY
jgi:outer membrane protein OmpA-like peptidoglycan-associated protein